MGAGRRAVGMPAARRRPGRGGPRRAERAGRVREWRPQLALVGGLTMAEDVNGPRCGRHSRLPSVDRVVRTDPGVATIARFGHKATVGAIRRTLSALREVVDGDGVARADA